VDAAGDIFFLDSAPGMSPGLRKISGGVVTTLVSAVALGLSLSYGSEAILYEPGQIAVDSAGNVFIPDYYRGLVDKVSNGIVTPVAGGGCGCSGDSGPATDATLSGPVAVATDSSGSLYIDEIGDNRVRKVSEGIIATIAGNGTGGFSGDGGPATAAELYGPQALAVDPAGNVYVADGANNRIRVLTPSGPCAYSVSSTSFQVPGSGGSLTVVVQTAAFCPWEISSLPAWITGATFGNGPATIGMAVAANPGAARSWSVSIAGADVQVAQAASSIPSVYSGGVVNAASPAVASPVAPGSIASAYGYFPSIFSWTALSSTLPNQLGGLSMQFGIGSGIAAPLFAVSSGQVNFQVPWELANQSTAPLSVTVNGQSGPALAVNLSPFAPGIFTMNGQGTGQGAVLDTSYRLVNASNPATAGSSVIQIYCTGLGSVSNQPATGSPGLSDPLSWTVTTPSVTIGGVAAQVVFSGLAPGAVGEYQLNVVVPAGSSKGDAVPVAIQIVGFTSNTATIAVQ